MVAKDDRLLLLAWKVKLNRIVHRLYVDEMKFFFKSKPTKVATHTSFFI